MMDIGLRLQAACYQLMTDNCKLIPPPANPVCQRITVNSRRQQCPNSLQPKKLQAKETDNRNVAEQDPVLLLCP